MKKIDKILLLVAFSVLVAGIWVNLAWLYSKTNCSMFTYQGGIIKTFLNMMVFWQNYCEPTKPFFMIV